MFEFLEHLSFIEYDQIFLTKYSNNWVHVLSKDVTQDQIDSTVLSEFTLY